MHATTTHTPRPDAAASGLPISAPLATAAGVAQLGNSITRAGLVIVLAWIGAMKFTAYEAAGIAPLVRSSPILSWVYAIWSVQTFSNLLGLLEIAMALMIALEAVSARIAVAGAGLAIATFVTTLSFLISTPGWEPSLGGFPALAVLPGQFLLKDLVLLGASVQVLGSSLRRLRG